MTSFPSGIYHYNKQNTILPVTSVQPKCLNSKRYDEEVASSTETHKGTTYIKLHLDIQYFTCVSPFRLKICNNGEYGIVHSNFLMRGVSIIHIIIRVFWCTCNIRKTLIAVNYTKGTVVLIKYFNFVGTIFGSLSSLYELESLWKRQKSFLKLHNLIQTSKVCKELSVHVVPKFVILLVLHLSVGIFLFPGKFGIISEGDPIKLFKSFVLLGRSIAFQSNSLHYMTNQTRFSEFNSAELTYGFGAMTFTMYLRIIGVQFQLLGFLFCYIFWKSCASFEKLWKQEESPLRSEIFSQYRELRQVAKAINECYGRIFFWTLLNILTYMATRMDSIIVVKDWILWFSFMFEFVFVSAALILASEGTRKMKAFSIWLVEEEQDGMFIDRDLQRMRNDLSQKSVAISGAELVTIDYSCLGMMMSFVVTYFIVVIQSR